MPDFSEPDPGSPSDGERRERGDRRRRPTRPWDSLRGWSRRARSRRSAEEQVYVDVFRPRDLLLLLGIFLLNLLDAGFTLVYLSRGGSEANPAMAHLLELGRGAFLGQKCAVVALWLIFLIVHKNFRVARYGLWSLLALYAGVLAYHFVLQLRAAA
jgi:hypothetical protein